MNTNYLEYYIAVYRTKNMHKAAEQLYISQQGLSRIIQSLENEWGTVFFERSNQGMEPTKAGVYFYEKALAMHNELMNLRRDFAVLNKGKKEIRLALVYNSLHTFHPFLEQYRATHPEVQVRLFEVSERIAKRMLLAKEVEGALLTENEGNDPIVFRPLFAHRQYLLVYEGHPLFECDEICHSMLRGESLIMESSSLQMINHFNNTCKNAGFIPDCILQSPNVAFCCRLCSQGEGLVVTMDTGSDYLNYSNIRRIPFGETGYISQVFFSRRNHSGADILELEQGLFSMIPSPENP